MASTGDILAWSSPDPAVTLRVASGVWFRVCMSREDPAARHTEPTDGARAGDRHTPEPAPWWDVPTRSHLGVMAEGAASLAGFEISVISVRRGEWLEVAAAAGPGVPEEILGTRIPVELLERELGKADDWGVWRFGPHGRMGEEVLEYSHVPEF